ncbi:MAG: flippase-like domain-containing protein [Leptospira sp.]|nr:flippase-like domain-containing protein [Leptospira sp.]
MRKFAIGILISLLAIILLAYKFDLNEFYKIKDGISYIYFLPFAMSGLFGYSLFSLRWYLLLEKKIKFKHAFACCILGGGANMVLPARGGDLLRIYYCKSETGIPYAGLLSKMFIEKVIDFITVILIGLVSFFLLGMNSDTESYAIFTYSAILILGIVVSLFLVRFKNALIVNILSGSFRLIGKDHFFEVKLKHHIIEIGEFLTLKTFFFPGILTVVMWLTAYFLGYYCIQELIGIRITYVETLFIMFCGAMGVAVPSAPSGIGVYHAAVIGGFTLLGRTSGEGLVFATATHLSQFMIFSLMALFVYLYWTWRRRHKK